MKCTPVSVNINKKLSCRKDSRPYCHTAPLGSHDVIGHVTIWYPICQHFLLVVLWNQASISNSFRDIQRRM